MPEPSSSGISSPSDYVGEIVAFGSTLALAWYWNWKAGDLVWSLWLSSLCVGYLVLLSQILHQPMQFVRGALTEDHGFSGRQVVLGLVVASAFAGFILAFFTFHFGAFHYAHGFLLEGFFPIEGASYPSGTVDFFGFVVLLLGRYYGMVLASVVVQLRRILKPGGLKKVAQPYAAVIKIHLMIFVFAGLNAFGATNFFFYAATLFAYFFPWRSLRRQEMAPA